MASAVGGLTYPANGAEVLELVEHVDHHAVADIQRTGDVELSQLIALEHRQDAAMPWAQAQRRDLFGELLDRVLAELAETPRQPASFAGYMATRSVVLAGAALVLLAIRAWRPLSLVLALSALVQLLDAVLGATRQELLETVSPAIIAVALLAAVAVIRRSGTAAQPE